VLESGVSRGEPAERKFRTTIMLRPHLFRFFCALLLFGLAGCNGSAPPATKGPAAATPAKPLKVLVVDDPELGDAIVREWRSRTEGELVVENYPAQRLREANRLPGDIVVFAVGELGSLAERGLILPLDEEAFDSEQYDRRDIFDQVRLRDVSWGKRTFAAPLGSPQLLLVYRADVFEKLGLNPPQTWEEYLQVANALASKQDDTSLIPALEPLAPGWAGQMLLARAAPYVTHRDQISPLWHYSTLEPLITAPPYVKALEQMAAIHQIAAAANPGESDSEDEPDAADRPAGLTPAEVIEALGTGKGAMGLCWPAPEQASDSTYEVALKFTLLPGSADTYDFARKQWETREKEEQPQVPLLAVAGRLAAVTTSSSDPQGAQNLVGWLASREVSPAVSPASRATTLFRTSQLPEVRRWTPRLAEETAANYGEALAQATSRERHISLRIPGRHEYLAALDAAVESVLSGEQSAEEALAKAAEAWQTITDKYGREAQKRALKRDLGQETFQ
jgi:multiple sugar transport system substrate-binding protein